MAVLPQKVESLRSIFFVSLVSILSVSFLSCSSRASSVQTPPPPTVQEIAVSLDSLTQGLAYVREHPAQRPEEQTQRYLWLDRWTKLLQEKGRLTPELGRDFWADFDGFLKEPPATSDTLVGILDRVESQLARNVALYAAYQERLRDQRVEDALKFLERVEVDGITDLRERALEILKLNIQPAGPGTRKIGILLPLKGELKAFAQEALTGFQIASRLAVAETVEFLIEDTGENQEQVVEAWQKLVDRDNVTAILGPLTAKDTEMVFERAEVVRVPVISMAAREGLRSLGSYGFRSALLIEDQVRAASELLKSKMNVSKVAILSPDSTYGWDVMDRAATEFESKGIEVTDLQIYPAEATDFKDQLRRMARLDQPKLRKDELCPKDVKDPALLPPGCVKRLNDLKPIVSFEALFVPDFAETVGLILPNLPYLRLYGVQVVGLSGAHSKRLIERASESAEGFALVDSYSIDSDRVVSRLFRDEFKRVSEGREPSRIAAEAFDLAMMAIQTMTRDQNSVSRDIFVDRFRRIENFEGVTGVLSVKDQRVVKSLDSFIVRGNKFVKF